MEGKDFIYANVNPAALIDYVFQELVKVGYAPEEVLIYKIFDLGNQFMEQIEK